MSVSAEDHHFDSEGGQYTFTVESNYSWTAGTEASWLTIVVDNGLVSVSADPNLSEEPLSGTVIITAGQEGLSESIVVNFYQGTRADNPYLKLLGKWEITSSKWYYSPNGSLNSTDVVNPDPNYYYLIFDLEEGEYGKTYMMRNFLYPNTSLEIRYDKESGNIIIPFGWTVYSYDIFLYVTLIGASQFSYASLEVDGIPSEDYSSIDLDLPSVDGFSYVGFGLWTYDDSGSKIAVGSRSYPTMFPMSPVKFKKYTPKTDA